MDKYLRISICISLVPYTRDPNKHKFVTRIIMYVNMLYEFMKILRSVTVICLIMIQYKCMCTNISYKIRFPLRVKLSTGF